MGDARLSKNNIMIPYCDAFDENVLDELDWYLLQDRIAGTMKIPCQICCILQRLNF